MGGIIMNPNSRTGLIFLVITILILCGMPFSAKYIGQNTAVAQMDLRGSAAGRMNISPPGQGTDRGGRGGDRGGQPGGMSGFTGPFGRGSFPLSDDEIRRVLEALRKSDPNKANELEKIRYSNPQSFMEGLRTTKEYNNLIDNRISRSDAQRRSEFLTWLEQYVPREAEKLKELKTRDLNLYSNAYELTWRKYSRVFDQSQQNSDPNWSRLLVRDLDLTETQTMLTGQIRNPMNSPQKRNGLEAQLREIVGERYDIGLKQRKITYQQQLQRLKDLEAYIDVQLDELKRGEDPNEKSKMIESQMRIILNPFMRGGMRIPSSGGDRGGRNMMGITDPNAVRGPMGGGRGGMGGR
jgi:hypothetical protein